MKKANKKFIVLNEVESTNNYAKQMILSNAEEGSVVLAQYQVKGKGQQGNSWESEPGKNMLASIVLYPLFLNAGNQFLISKIVSLALCDFLRSKVEGVTIKWPNDVYVGDKKIAGILIENVVSGNNLHSSVLGVGLNLNQTTFLSDAFNPVSLKQITGFDYDVNVVAKTILEAILTWYDKLKFGKYDEIDAAYLSNLYRIGELSKYKKEGIIFEAKIVGIGKFGQLQLKKPGGIVEEYLFKEVEFVF